LRRAAQSSRRWQLQFQRRLTHLVLGIIGEYRVMIWMWLCWSTHIIWAILILIHLCFSFCWLRDAFHTVRALNRLSETRTMEAYIRFISNIAASYNHSLQPLYGVLFETDLPEKLLDTLPGYRGMVRHTSHHHSWSLHE
jgi:hypothetical protein